MIVAEVPYEVTDPTVDSQIVSLKASGADVFFNVTTPKFAAQAIRKAAEIGWKPLHLLNNVSASVGIGAASRPGSKTRKGIVSTALLQGPDRPDLEGRRRLSRNGWPSWTSTIPDGDKTDAFNVYGYTVAADLVQVLKQCGDDLTRENVMKQAASLKDLAAADAAARASRSTPAPTDFYPIKQMQMAALQRRALDPVRQGPRSQGPRLNRPGKPPLSARSRHRASCDRPAAFQPQDPGADRLYALSDARHFLLCRAAALPVQRVGVGDGMRRCAG